MFASKESNFSTDGSATQNNKSSSPGGCPNVIDRLRGQVAKAKKLGFEVRTEALGDQPADWCEVGGKKLMFVDISQAANEQLQQIERLLAEYLSDE